METPRNAARLIAGNKRRAERLAERLAQLEKKDATNVNPPANAITEPSGDS